MNSICWVISKIGSDGTHTIKDKLTKHHRPQMWSTVKSFAAFDCASYPHKSLEIEWSIFLLIYENKVILLTRGSLT